MKNEKLLKKLNAIYSELESRGIRSEIATGGDPAGEKRKKMNKITIEKTALEGELIEFFANDHFPTLREIFDADPTGAARSAVVDAERRWNSVEIDREGATAEQDQELDKVIDDCVAELRELNLEFLEIL